jgi:hypothetical protein
MRTRSLAGAAGVLAALLTAAGCGEPGAGEVTGTVTVDGQVPPDGSSITFVPTDGKSPTAGASIESGKYTTKVPVGAAKVQIRVPKFAAGKPKAAKGGPGPGGPDGGQTVVGDALPDKFNNKTELTYDVKPGRQEKNWELSTK